MGEKWNRIVVLSSVSEAILKLTLNMDLKRGKFVKKILLDLQIIGFRDREWEPLADGELGSDDDGKSNSIAIRKYLISYHDSMNGWGLRFP
jgi:hypothetical protein